MQLFEQIKQILDNHECKCYDIDVENYKLNFIGHKNSCCTLNPAVADITGFLLSHNIDYEMDEQHNIMLHLIQNIKLESSLVNLQNIKI